MKNEQQAESPASLQDTESTATQPKTEILSSSAFRIAIYVSITLAFTAFFWTVLSNKNSRYSQRLQQSDARISNRMDMMRKSYLQQDSLFRAEQDSLQRLERQQQSSGH